MRGRALGKSGFTGIIEKISTLSTNPVIRDALGKQANIENAFRERQIR